MVLPLEWSLAGDGILRDDLSSYLELFDDEVDADDEPSTLKNINILSEEWSDFLLLELLQSFLLNEELLEFLIVDEIDDELRGLLVPFWLLKNQW